MDRNRVVGSSWSGFFVFVILIEYKIGEFIVLVLVYLGFFRFF